ncbi:MAG TPA: GntR family transcriptional regulator [Steroidobacteraceae bacterium]
MTLFNFTLQRGTPIMDQVMFASVRSMLRGEYQPGQPFPSVRAIAASLKIHPNTAHKVVQALIEEGWLENRTGVGTLVAARPRTRSGDWRKTLRDDVDRLIVKARSNELSLAEVSGELTARWEQFEPS